MVGWSYLLIIIGTSKGLYYYLSGNSRKLKLKRVEKGAFNGVELIGLSGLNSADERKIKKLIKNKGCKKIID